MAPIDLAQAIANSFEAMECGFPGCYGPVAAARAVRGLEALWTTMSESEQKDVAARLRSMADLSSLDEVLTAGAFTDRFGGVSVLAPNVGRADAKPEFYVQAGDVRLAVECVSVGDNASIRELRHLAAGGREGSVTVSDDHDPTRLHRTIVRKMSKAVHGCPWVLVVSSRTYDICPSVIERVVQRLLTQTGALGLPTERLPVAIAGLWASCLHGIWFSEEACRLARLPDSERDRLRQALTQGFVNRAGGGLMSEADWTDAGPV